MRCLLALIVVLSACSEIETLSTTTAESCFREAPEAFAAKEEAKLRAEVATPDRPACNGSLTDGRAVCDVRVEAYVDAEGRAVKVSTATTRGVGKDGRYTTLEARCSLTCSGQACLMAGCSSTGDNCSAYNCGEGCTGTCSKQDLEIE